jgi:hypothetical protein
VHDSEEVVRKGFLKHMKKKCQHFKCTGTLVLGTDNDKINSDDNDSGSKTC